MSERPLFPESVTNHVDEYTFNHCLILREVHPAEEGLEAEVGADPDGVCDLPQGVWWALAQGVCVPGAHVYAVPFRLAAALVAVCGMSAGFLPWASFHQGALDRIVLPPC